MLRIGRDPTPAERALQLALENGEFLDNLALNLMEHVLRLSSVAAEERWTGFTEEERDIWRDRVVGDLREVAEAGVQEDPAPGTPDPGAAVSDARPRTLIALG